jgi:hypothetical protein
MGIKPWLKSVASITIAEGTFYRWKKQYGGMEVAEAKRLKGLEKENAGRSDAGYPGLERD